MESESTTSSNIQPQPDIPAPPQTPWGAWTTIGFGVAIFSINFFAQFIILLVFALIMIFSRMPSLDPDGFNEFASALSTNGLMVSVATIISSIAGVGITLLFARLRKGISLAQYMAWKKISLKTVLVLFGLVLGLLALFTIFNQFRPTSQETDPMVELYRSSVWPALFWIAVVVFAPVFEEVFFRGFIFAGLLHSPLRAFGTIVLTSLVFASLHIQYDLLAMAQIFILGLVLGIVRLKTGSLWSPIIVHALWNFIQLVLLSTFIDAV